ncbi:flagellar hook capping FlgD N-terminal domain-containing protein [Clostridium sp.]|uniref:flagellar hook capping FlgD N-terminal domain-containing protein n=1 Tax=Clostridium sp. TaxID=1506 RepID=UPI002618FDBC|nr:flagellar hook capping FlgD N-terminal domain-containing protein [Clostridium sp.]
MSTTSDALNNSKVSINTTGSTSTGNKIVTSTGGSMDKNAFLKILAAELSNLDPTQNQDSSAYVTQMAQFSEIEQMNNLNSTMTQSSYQQLIGKGVVVTDTDSSGNNYTGIVKSVTTDTSGSTYLGVLVNENGTTTTKTFNAADLYSVIDSSDSTTSSLSTTALNTSFLAASALKGQKAVISTTDSSGNSEEVSGTVESVYIDNGKVMIKLTKEDGTTEEYPYSSILTTGNADSSSSASTSSTTTA